MNEAEKVKAAQALKALKEDWPAVLERYAIFAAMHKAIF